ncbi:conjugative transposon protein TraM [Flavobacterium psychroterrae]|uniref:Conjugative transposon protein TraM n=1 Tax=Flavobacterium psychroterrae TaxID=2133767 RepID=A0ABS5P9F3_9FLAO|nr:conjugative transposon protein TraM [Flavobacterium psychroterrae]MBS7230959.1 conjugative transposon protein TraM [Flavobacterium psychroterrae]
MEHKTLSPKQLKRRRLLFMLPLLTLPFLTMLFWTLGGGTPTIAAIQNKEQKGFNFELPLPKFKEDDALDKMSYYDKAATDSLKLLEEIKKDPNYSDNIAEEEFDLEWQQEFLKPKNSRKGKTALSGISEKDPASEKIYQKLASLQKIINEPQPYTDPEQDMREFDYRNNRDDAAQDMKSLEQMMTAMTAPQQADPELKQLGGMLENILDIQHPERMQEKLKQSSKNQKGKTYAVDKKKAEDNLTFLEAKNGEQNSAIKQNAFFSAEEESSPEENQNALEAVIHQTQTIVSGSVIKLRLTGDVVINNVSIPSNSFLYGTAALKGERLEVKISTIKYQNSILPVELEVYDMDGIPGIYIPGTINRESAKASADRSIQAVGLATLDDSWGAQAAGMGVEAAKSLLSKKVKLIKVVVKSGYRVLLYDEKQKNAN